MGGLQWYDINGNGKHAQTDDEKATALLDFFSTVYTTDNDNDFDSTNTRINDIIISVNDIYDKLCQ